MRYKTIVLALLIILSALLFTRCGFKVPSHSYTRAETTCPKYPKVKHMRAHSKHLNPENCNFIW